MSDIIQLLPDSVANQIAAGEVIQRPASVIKELVENAVDAGATRIEIMVVDAGRTSIQVIDNGKGMSETDARLSFERHATSKIKQPEDLFNLRTMGFRGEALASIAAVAQVQLKTRMADDEVGTQISIAGSQFTGQEACACSVGSNFLVENLFYNVPARRRFLKTNTTELNKIIEAFQRIALVYPDLSFVFYSNGSEMFNLKAGPLRKRIVEIFGKRINQDLLPVDVETSVCGIHGFVGKPESAKKKGVHQYFFVNGRYMRHPYFHKAVMSAFERLVPQGDQVPYFLYFDVDPKDIDVNIHPTKTEIKFENEQAIWQILTSAVKGAVGLFNEGTALDFDDTGRPDIPLFDPDNDMPEPEIDLDPNYNPFSAPVTTPSDSFGRHGSSAGYVPEESTIIKSHIPNNWEDLYSGPTPESDELVLESASALFGDMDSMSEEADLIAEKAPSHYQFKGKYIMTAVKSGLMVVDQHRAHIRILYEQYVNQWTVRKFHSQKVMFPETIQFTVQESLVYEKIASEVADLGFELTDLGSRTYAINGIPEGFEGIDVCALLQNLIAGAQEKGKSGREEIAESFALSMARAAAIPYGQVLSNDEMENVINSLFLCQNVNYTPDGKTVLHIFEQQDIDEMFE